MLTRWKNAPGDQTGVCLTFERLNQCSEEKVDAADETQGHLTAYGGQDRRAVRREGARACTSPGDLRRSNPVRQRGEVTGSAEAQRRCRPVRRLCGAAWIRWRCHALEAGATAMTRPGPRQGAPPSTCSSSGSLFSPGTHLLFHLTSSFSSASQPTALAPDRPWTCSYWLRTCSKALAMGSTEHWRDDGMMCATRPEKGARNGGFLTITWECPPSFPEAPATLPRNVDHRSLACSPLTFPAVVTSSHVFRAEVASNSLPASSPLLLASASLRL